MAFSARRDRRSGGARILRICRRRERHRRPGADRKVPNVVGKKLKAATKALENAKCKLGTVKKLAGATPKSGKVSKQGAKPGSQLAVNAKVAVTLKPAKPAAKKPKHGKQ
jgi:beta-lactam-binding protein with PASTA domain